MAAQFTAKAQTINGQPGVLINGPPLGEDGYDMSIDDAFAFAKEVEHAARAARNLLYRETGSVEVE